MPCQGDAVEGREGDCVFPVTKRTGEAPGCIRRAGSARGRRRVCCRECRRPRSTCCSSRAGIPRTTSRGGGHSWQTSPRPCARPAVLEVTVASFEPTHVRGVADTRADRAARGERRPCPAVATPDALNRPAGGARGRRSRSPGCRPSSTAIAVGRPTSSMPMPARSFRSRRGTCGRDRPSTSIHAHTGLPDGLAALRVAEALDLPLLVTEHSSTAVDELVDDRTRARCTCDCSHRRAGWWPSHGPWHEISPGPSASGRTHRRPAERGAGRRISARGRQRPGRGRTALRRLAKGEQGHRDAPARLRRGARPASDVRLRLIGPPGQPAEEARWAVVIGGARASPAR